MVTVIAIPFRTFKEQIKIVNEWTRKKAAVEVLGNIVYIVHKDHERGHKQ